MEADTENIIKLIFKHGYMLGFDDAKEGIYISLKENESYYLNKLKTLINQDDTDKNLMREMHIINKFYRCSL